MSMLSATVFWFALDPPRLQTKKCLPGCSPTQPAMAINGNLAASKVFGIVQTD